MKVNLINPNYQSNYIRNLLNYRGVQDFTEFLMPPESSLQSPTALDNVHEAFTLIMDTLKTDKPIALVVDCDCDGFTSASIIYLYLKDLKPDVEIEYFLHEHKGHGLQDIIERIMDSDKEWGLVISPDAGSNDFAYHELLRTMGVPVLVMDHHELDREVSPNCVLVNNQTSKNYQNKDLTGAGVTWQVCRYIDSQLETHYADKYIDLCALGNCGDMCSVLSMENRYIMYEGFNRVRNGFFRAIVDKQSFAMKDEVNPTTVAFYIVPLINSIVRVGTMEEKEHMFQAFIDPDSLIVSHKRGANGALEKVSIECLREATNARNRQNKILDGLEDSMEARIAKYDLLSNKVLFIRLEEEDDFPAEINGLLAMRLSKRHKMPTIVARLNEQGIIRGSARGLDQSELKDFKEFCAESGLFEYTQGHANAYGISIPDKNLTAFHTYANEKLKDTDFGENVYDVSFERLGADEDITDLIMELGKYPEVWGTKNPVPLVYIKDVLVYKSDVQIIGQKKNTFKIVKNGVTYICFNAEKLIEEIEGKGSFKMDIVGTANINEWGGAIMPQIIIDGYEIFEDNGF